MERDDEVKGSGNSYDFGARLYDSRLGRWLAVDKKANYTTELSPYCFVANNNFINYEVDGNYFTDGQNRVKVKIKRDKDGQYYAKYTYSKNTKDEQKKYFQENAQQVIDASIQTRAGRREVRKANRTDYPIEIRIVDEPMIVTNTTNGERGFTYGLTELNYYYSSDGTLEISSVLITISKGSFEYGKTVDPATGKGDPNVLPENMRQFADEIVAKNPDKLFKGTYEEYLAQTGTHEIVHSVNDLMVNRALIQMGVLNADTTPAGKDGSNELNKNEQKYYDAIEKKPYRVEAKVKKQMEKKGK
ncbi:MAG TPA: hypothetical protein PK637_17440 [Flavobacteriales bacterium]|nr:hypothetical protein [Flavobacteriales bacterium]HRE98553.1 hypothetical protein [Flavobacteriales bacterium]HRJ39650.1 hypothetical protein [Flavobacteriales bacterium]